MTSKADMTLLRRSDRQPCAVRHTPSPSGYLDWDRWAGRMAATHVQQQCPDCHLWLIWVPKDPEPAEVRP